MPYCIKSAAAPATKGDAIDVPVCIVYPPPGAVLNIFTAGAPKIRFCIHSIRKTLARKGGKYIKAAVVAADTDYGRRRRRNRESHVRRRCCKACSGIRSIF